MNKSKLLQLVSRMRILIEQDYNKKKQLDQLEEIKEEIFK